MSRRKGKYYTPPTPLGFLGIIAVSVVMTWLMFAMDSGAISIVELTTNCQDGRQVSIRVPDSKAEATAEFKKRGCIQVDAAGNLLKFDPNTGESIYVDPVTGERVEGVE